jgi:hypothetical protein
MFQTLKTTIACALVGIGFVACAHGEDDDDYGYQSGVDGRLDLNGLTPDQRVRICSTQAAYVHAQVDTTSLMRFVCAFTPAVLGAVDDVRCEAAMAQCLSAFSVKVDVKASGAVPLECALSPLSPCSGTVADYEACVEALADVQLQIGTDFSCGKRAQYAGGPTVGVSACAALGPSCTSASTPPVIQ